LVRHTKIGRGRAKKLDFDKFSAPFVEIFRSVTPNFAVVKLSNWNLWSRITPPVELIVKVQHVKTL
jgi:hypothetical protein